MQGSNFPLLMAVQVLEAVAMAANDDHVAGDLGVVLVEVPGS